MRKALEILASHWYTPESEKGETTPTRFKIRGLTGIDRHEIFQHVSLMSENKYTIDRKGAEACLHRGLVGWEHFADAGGAVPFNGDMSINLARLDQHLISELVDAIMDRTEITETEKKIL